MSEEKALHITDDLESIRLKETTKVVCEGCSETLTCTRFPMEHWKRIRTNNTIGRLNRKIRRHTRIIGTFPDGNSAHILATVRLKCVTDSKWVSRRYLNVSLLKS